MLDYCEWDKWAMVRRLERVRGLATNRHSRGQPIPSRQRRGE